MPKYIGSSDDVVRTTSGHVVVFKAGEETSVPDDPLTIKMVKQAGHRPVQEKPAAPPARKSSE